MKQTAFMVMATFIGVVGAVVIEPFIGVAVYYCFAVLRPQFHWNWALPADVSWSGYVAWATLLGTLVELMRGRRNPEPGPRISAGHWAYFLFAGWITVTYLTSLNREVAWPYFVEYLKIFVMFGLATLAIEQRRHIYWVYLITTVTLIYIAFELNFVYFAEGRVDIYRSGYGGLDNNGAALGLAMGVPLAMHLWEGLKAKWRWGLLAGIPLILHAVLMSYSRGAMVSLIVLVPVLFARSRRKAMFGFCLVMLLATVPFLAGKEIRERFFSVQQYEVDDSAQSRIESWKVAFKIANDYPVFGVGIRNSNLLSYNYGADVEGRTIHSQYLQVMADNGYVGVLLYLAMLGGVFVSLKRTRRFIKQNPSEENDIAYSMLNGIEGAIIVFCFGSMFLSLGLFELPHIMVLLALQLGTLIRLRAEASVVASRTTAEPPIFFGMRRHAP